jgi:hypothetical protein
LAHDLGADYNGFAGGEAVEDGHNPVARGNLFGWAEPEAHLRQTGLAPQVKAPRERLKP